MAQLDVQTATAVAIAKKAWPEIALILTSPKNEEEFRRLIDVSDQLIDTGAGDENHPLAGLLYLVGMLIEEYEKAHDPTW